MNTLVRDRVAGYLERQSAPRTLAQIARGAQVSRPAARKCVAELGGQGRIIVSGQPGSPAYRLASVPPPGWEQIAGSDLDRLGGVLDLWVASFRRRSGQAAAVEAAVQLGFEFSEREPGAVGGMLAVAVMRLAQSAGPQDPAPAAPTEPEEPQEMTG